MWLMAEDQIKKIEALQAQVPAEVRGSDIFTAGPDPKLNINGDTAVLDIKGVLTKHRDPALAYFGVPNTAYTDVSALLSEAKRMGASKVTLKVDSPGGHVDGLYPCMSDIADCGMDVTAVVEGMAASGAYMLASQAGVIKASNELDLIGSVGVVTGASTSPFFTEITNTASPKKRPNARTEEGQAAIKEGLDDIYDVIADKIAAGRGTSVDKVNKDYGQGAVMTAKTALKRQMIDAIETTTTVTSPVEVATKQQGEINMDVKELKANHADLFTTVFEAGAKAELERVEAHLQLADASGDMETAKQAISAGDGITDKVKAAHLSAEIKKQSISLRETEAPKKIETASPVEVSDFDKLAADLKSVDADIIVEA